jgi:hypothetical protein
MSLPATAAPYLAATVLLGAAGVAKIVRPSDTANALRTAGQSSRRLPSQWLHVHRLQALVRIGAAGEVALAVAAVVVPGALTGALVAAVYGGFALFVGLALQRGWALSSCGCFGRPDTRPTPAHAALNVGAAVSAVWWAATWGAAPLGVGSGLGRLGRLFVHEPWHGAPLGLLIVVLCGLAYLIWTDPLPAAHR